MSPHVAVIAIGRAFETPCYVSKSFAGKPILKPELKLSFSISGDHRILDGAYTTRFAQHIKKYIENPNLMLISI